MDSAILELVADVGCECDDHREAGEHDCTAGKAEAEYYGLKADLQTAGTSIAALEHDADEIDNEREKRRKAEHALVSAFVQGAKWWEYHKEGATMWQSDQGLALTEAERREASGSLGVNDNYPKACKDKAACQECGVIHKPGQNTLCSR